MEWVIDSNELAARTWGRTGVHYENVRRRTHAPSTLREIALGRTLVRYGTCPCRRSPCVFRELGTLHWGRNSWVGRLTDAKLTRSTMPSTRVSTSISTRLFHSSSMLSRYSAELWSMEAWALPRESLAVGRAEGRETSVWGISAMGER